MDPLEKKSTRKNDTYNSVHLVDVAAVVAAVGFAGLVAQLVAFPVALRAVDTSKKTK